MTELVPFDFDGHRVRVELVDGEPVFVHVDVCAVLDIGNPSDVLRRLDDDERTLVSIDGPNGRQVEVNAVTEAGLYSLILGSRKPQARPFKRWVTHEVLPQIRRTGRYQAAPAPVAIPTARELAQLVIAAEDRADAEAARAQVAEQKIAELEPRVAAADALLDADGTVSMGAVANMFGIGRTTFFKMLRTERILQGDRRPYQEYADWFRVVTGTYESSDGGKHVHYTSHMYPAGALRLHALLSKRGHELRKPLIDNQLRLLDGGAA